jgi:hypothetical protein
MAPINRRQRIEVLLFSLLRKLTAGRTFRIMLRSVLVYLVDVWLAYFSDSLGSNPIRRSKFAR